MYGEDLAWIHHTGFAEFAESASSGILEILWKHGITSGIVVDVGCGSGILSRELARAKFEVVGFDASAAMIDLARKTEPRARFEVARFAEATLPPCDAIVAVGEVLNYGTLDEVRAFFANAADALRQGGVLLFDVAERNSYPPYDERQVGGDDFTVIAIKESDGVRLTRRVLVFREVDGKIRRSEEVHTLELYEREALVALLRPHFRVKVRRSYLSRRLPKGHMVYECVRR
jgi:SAM-dependent methyltransferase